MLSACCLAANGVDSLASLSEGFLQSQLLRCNMNVILSHCNMGYCPRSASVSALPAKFDCDARQLTIRIGKDLTVMTFSRVTRSILAALSLVAIGASLAPACAAATFNPSDTSVQLFKWRWPDIATECTQWLGPQGYGAVQISPPTASKLAHQWWDAYQPVDFNSLTSEMGNAAQLQAMITACHAAGVRVYADIVTNQLADQSSSADGVAADGASWDSSTLSYPQFSSSDFHNNTTAGQCANADGNIDPSDYLSSGNRNNVMFCRLGGLPDLATENSHVQSVIVAYLSTLASMGIDGFRLDAAKHQQPAALQSIFNALKTAYPTTLAGESFWITQEVIPDGNVVRSDYFGIGTINEFQFTYGMRDIFRGNNGLTLSSIPSVMGTPGNWGGSWGFVQPQNATVFVDNWDTERNDGSLTADNYTGSGINDHVGTKRYDLANIFMLASPYGEAQVESGYHFANTNDNPPSTSPYDSNGNPLINISWDFIHRWPDISNMVKFRSAAHGQSLNNWVTGSSNQIAFSRGNVGFVALNNDSSAWNNSFQTGLPAGSYCDVITGTLSGSSCSGNTVTVDANGNATLTVPANGGTAIPAVAIYTGQKIGNGVPDTTPPSVPTGLAASAISGNGATLSWAGSTDNVGGSGVAGYIVLRNGVAITTVAGTSYGDTGLSASTSYSYTVEAKDNAGNISTASAPLVVKTSTPDILPPTAPGTPVAGSVTATAVSLSWAAATDNVGVVLYDIYRNNALIGTSTTTSFTDSSVAPGTSYSYTIKAVDGAGNISLASTALSVSTPIGNIATVYYQAANSWTTVNIHYGINNVWTTVPGVSMSAACTGWMVKAINLGTAASFQAVFNNGNNVWDNNSNANYTLSGGISAIANGKVTTGTSPCPTPDTTPPSVPAGLAVSALTSTSLTLSWAASTDNVAVTGYYVLRNGSKIATVTGTSYADSGLSPGTAYSYTVHAFDAAANVSVASSALVATTPGGSDTQPPTVPANLVVTPLSSTSVTVSWAASTDNVGVAGYQVWATNVAVVVKGATSYTFTNLLPGTGYNFTVRAFDAAGNYSALAPAVHLVTTGGSDTQPPTTPTGLTLKTATATSLTLSWNAATDNVGVAGYQVWLGNQAVKVTATSYTFAGLPPSTAYNATVRAYDAAGNYSTLAPVLAVKTLSSNGQDVTPPSQPANLAASTTSSSGFTVSWTASTDNVGVVGYQVWIGNVATKVSGTSYTAAGLVAGSAYNVTVRAYDAAGNWSALTPVLQVKTSQ